MTGGRVFSPNFTLSMQQLLSFSFLLTFVKPGKHLLLLVFVVLLGFAMPCKALTGVGPGKGIRICIQTQFDGRPLKLGQQLYNTSRGDSLAIESFKFYLSSIQLLRDGKVVGQANSGYHLFDASDSSTAWIVFDSPETISFTGIRFLFGVDSLANVSGALDGDLDPGLGMYWAWNTGYINARLTGTSPACATLHHSFEFHLGG
ncbi:MAG TPA: MbnP family protein, partial [Bacteroidia bacterium]|nr:MbnP family protein [Bacteroidia bacterium]